MKGLRLGVAVADLGGSELSALLDQLARAEAAGFESAWIPHMFGIDAMTLAALAGGVTRTLEVGTGVVPTHSRHPLFCAQQALSTQAALGGRFALGLGPSHRIVVEDMLGLSYARPARHVREYVTVVRQLLEKGQASFEGELYRVKGSVDVASGPPPPLLIGALGPAMCRIAGEICDGTVTWMTGPRTLTERVVPAVRDAAAGAGRPPPRIVAGVPIVLTDDPGAARERAARSLAGYESLPSYRAMLDAERAAGPADLLIAGDERTLETALRGLGDAGATEVNAAIFPAGPDPQASVRRTHAFLGELARSR